MNVELIKIDRDAAKAKLAAYRKAIAKRHHTEAGRKASAEWEAIAAGYEAAAKGLPLIELTKAMAMGGWDELGRPRFAVGRADQRVIECSTSGAVVFEASGIRSLARFTFPQTSMPAPLAIPRHSRFAWACKTAFASNMARSCGFIWFFLLMVSRR